MREQFYPFITEGNMRYGELKAFAQSHVVHDEQSQNFKVSPINSQSLQWECS